MKILFLDIDGVLNSTRSVTVFGGYPHPERNHDKFDQISVGLIRKVCEETRAKIILSSTWRISKNFMEFGQILNLPIVGRTPEKIGQPRGVEIDLWMAKNGLPDRWAIIDDDSDMLASQIPFFVQTAHENGVTYENFKKLRELLT